MSEQRDSHDLEVEDLDVAAAEAEDVKGGETATGRRKGGTRPALGDITITKPIDKTSPTL